LSGARCRDSACRSEPETGGLALVDHGNDIGPLGGNEGITLVDCAVPALAVAL